MPQSPISLNYAIPSNKFYPPHIDDALSLFRDGLITKKLPGAHSAQKVLIIEAQAGQGKTTLAYQYITHFSQSFIWYQIGTEDSDPVLLLGALLMNFMKKLDGFQSSQLTAILNEGEIGPHDLSRCANILLSDLDNFLEQDLYVIFDDLHLIEEATLANDFLAYLIDTSPPKLHFILTSRHPITIKCKTLRNRNLSYYLSTKDLALDTYEIESLFNDIYDRSINLQEADHIQRITNGWVMGIVLAAHPKTRSDHLEKSTKGFETLSSPLTHGDLLDYFQEEIFTHIPEKFRKPFLQLSYLKEINVDLATLISGNDALADVLEHFTLENLFIYSLDDENKVYRFHHLFQEFLQQRAQKELSAEEIKAIHETSATYYLERHLLIEALTSYCHGKNFIKMDQILQNEGLGLLAQNRTLALLTLLRTIPDEVLIHYGWLTLFTGILDMDFSPEKILPYFESAMAKFVSSDEEIGELLAIAQIIYFHFVITGRYNTGAQLLPRAERLFIKNEEALPIHAKIWITRNMAAGFCFFSSQMEKAREYINKAKDLATQHKIRNFIAPSRFVLGYIELLTGNRSNCQREAERSYPHLYDPLVSMSNKVSLRVMHIADLAMHGDYLNFFHQQHLLQKTTDTTVVKQTITAPYVYVWGCSCLLSMGKIEDGLELIKKGADISGTARTDHMYSQLQQWLAYASSLLGDHKTAKEAIESSLQLRARAGGPFFEAFNHILAGATYTRLKLFEEASEHLTMGIELAEAIPSPYLQVCGLMNQSFNLLEKGDKLTSLSMLTTALKLMSKNNYTHFWSWEPQAMERLLVFGVKYDIEKYFCQQLAHDRLNISIDDEGKVVPLLYFSLLDDFNVQINNKKMLQVDNFTPFQREILGLLLFSKGHRISQEKIQLILWPDSPPDKARKKFDTLLGRLRKSFSDHLPLPVKHYITMQKGILSLQNIKTDIEIFQQMSEKAMAHSRRNEIWQAGNGFNSALSLWKGTLPSSTFNSDLVYNYETFLLDIFSKISITWAEILAETDQLKEAIIVTENLIKSNGLEESGIILLCRLYSQAKQPLKVRTTLERYKQALEKIDYTAAEIGEIIESIKDSIEN